MAIIAVEQTFTVNLSPSDPANYQLQGSLSYEGNFANQPLLILLPGATYNSSYWNPAVGPSFVKAANVAGYATLNLDRLGTGISSKPLGGQLTVGAESYALHQVVSDLKTGTLGGYGFNSLNLVGHSYGSAVAIAEAGQYRDVSSLVFTGFSHTSNPGGFAALGAAVAPTSVDPASSQSLPSGYFTTQAGSRGGLFYYASTASPAVIANDEATKDVVALGSFSGLSSVMGDKALSSSINVPVLGVVGSQDAFFTNDGGTDFLRNETGYYSGSPSVATAVILNTGHALALHDTANLENAVIFNWLDRNVSSGVAVPEPTSISLFLPAFLALVMMSQVIGRRFMRGKK